MLRQNVLRHVEIRNQIREFKTRWNVDRQHKNSIAESIN